MIGFLGPSHLVLQGNQHDGVVWTKRFTRHESRLLPSGLLLLIEDGFYSQGNRDRVRLSWYRRDGSKFKKVQTFEGETTLANLPPFVSGNRVRVKSVDEPHAFRVFAADDTFGIESTWSVEQGQPRLLSRKILAPRLRAVDAAIWNSWRAKSASPLQKKIRKAISEPDDLSFWTEKRYGRAWMVNVNDYYLFTLKRSDSGAWKVVDVKTTHKRRP